MHNWKHGCCINETLHDFDHFKVESFDISGLTAMSMKANQNWNKVPAEKFEKLSSEERKIFFSIYLIIYIVAVIGNIAAVIVTSKRKHRCIQKTCIISLALSDFITATSLAVMYLNTFSQRLIIWTLGTFMCSFLPSVPVFGVVCSSTVLVGIALDRYRNVVHALQKRWNPEMRVCLLTVVLVWIISIAIAYPMFSFFKIGPVRLVSYDYEKEQIRYDDAYLCITFRKHDLQIYYICIICLVFVPLFIIFLWLYYKIAQLVWKHRKPLSHIFNKKYESSASLETSTSHIRPSEEDSRTTFNSEIKPTVRSKNPRIKRKVRTFKIIIFLMFVFMILRLPSWIYDTIKLSQNIDTHAMWLTKYICTALTLLHCAFNPFLYTFINQTLDVITRICKSSKEFMCQVCCCCFSNTEFEEFENENPFMQGQFEKRVKNGSDSSISNKASPKNCKVQFDDLAVIKLYSPNTNTLPESYKEFRKY